MRHGYYLQKSSNRGLDMSVEQFTKLGDLQELHSMGLCNDKAASPGFKPFDFHAGSHKIEIVFHRSCSNYAWTVNCGAGRLR